MNEDYYQVLGLNQNATEDEIKKAYRRLALECHPDHHPADPKSEERFKLVSEAYSVLGDREKRQKYDLRSRRASAARSVFDQLDAEGMFWRFVQSEGFDTRKASCLDGMQRCSRSNSGIGSNFQPGRHGFSSVYEVSLTPAEAAAGVQKKVVVADARNPRTYTFRIPGGVVSGTTFTLVLDRRTGASVLLRITIDENGREVTTGDGVESLENGARR